MISHSGLVQFGIVTSFVLQSGHILISGLYSERQSGQPNIKDVIPFLYEDSNTVSDIDDFISRKIPLVPQIIIKVRKPSPIIKLNKSMIKFNTIMPIIVVTHLIQE